MYIFYLLVVHVIGMINFSFVARSAGRRLLLAAGYEAQQVNVVRRTRTMASSTVSDKFKVSEYQNVYVSKILCFSYDTACSKVGRN